MNNRYNYSDFSGISLQTNNELPHQPAAHKQAPVVTRVTADDTEKPIENTPLNHNKFYGAPE